MYNVRILKVTNETRIPITSPNFGFMALVIRETHLWKLFLNVLVSRTQYHADAIMIDKLQTLVQKYNRYVICKNINNIKYDTQ